MWRLLSHVSKKLSGAFEPELKTDMGKVEEAGMRLTHKPLKSCIHILFQNGPFLAGLMIQEETDGSEVTRYRIIVHNLVK